MNDRLVMMNEVVDGGSVRKPLRATAVHVAALLYKNMNVQHTGNYQ